MEDEKNIECVYDFCMACGSKNRISSILTNIDGISNIRFKGKETLIITFDDKKTTAAVIISKLKKGKFDVKGKPVYLKDDQTTK